jgi:hypothetical protein
MPEYSDHDSVLKIEKGVRLSEALKVKVLGKLQNYQDNNGMVFNPLENILDEIFHHTSHL